MGRILVSLRPILQQLYEPRAILAHRMASQLRTAIAPPIAAPMQRQTPDNRRCTTRADTANGTPYDRRVQRSGAINRGDSSMKHVALFTLLSLAGAAACSQNPLGPTAASASKTLAAPSAALPAKGSVSTSAPSASAPSASAPSASAPSSAAPAAAVPATKAAATPSDGSDCVQDGENAGECGSQVTDGTPDTGVPETPESGSPETPGTETPTK